MIPQTTNPIDDPETVAKIQKLLEMLDDLDDVQNVYHNGELPEEGRRGRLIPFAREIHSAPARPLHGGIPARCFFCFLVRPVRAVPARRRRPRS